MLLVLLAPLLVFTAPNAGAVLAGVPKAGVALVGAAGFLFSNVGAVAPLAPKLKFGAVWPKAFGVELNAGVVVSKTGLDALLLPNIRVAVPKVCVVGF